MNLSALFIERPVATTLLAVSIALSGLLAYFHLPVAPLPNVTYPVIAVQATMAGASPEIMASTVAEPLERRLATIAGVTQLTSNNSVGSSQVVAQFALNRDINGAARDVEAAIQAARATCRPACAATRATGSSTPPTRRSSSCRSPPTR